MKLTVQPKIKLPLPLFNTITQVANSFLNCKARKYNFNNLNAKIQTIFRETFSQKLTDLNNCLPKTAIKKTVLEDFYKIFNSDIKNFYNNYQKKYERLLNDFEKCFDCLEQKSILQLPDGKECPELEKKEQKVYEYCFSRRERLLPPAHFACLLENLICERINLALPDMIRQKFFERHGLKIKKYKCAFYFWNTVYYGDYGQPPEKVKQIFERKAGLKGKIREFINRLKNKKWALKLKNPHLIKEVEKPNVVANVAKNPFVEKMCELIAIARP